MTVKRLERFLLSGADAQKPENILGLFEQIKGRKATAQELAQFERKGNRQGHKAVG